MGKPNVAAAAVIIRRSLELFLRDNMLKKQVEENRKVGLHHAPTLHRLIDKTFGGLTSSYRLFVEKICLTNPISFFKKKGKKKYNYCILHLLYKCILVENQIRKKRNMTSTSKDDQY